MNAEKKMQERSGSGRPLTDRNACFMELFHQLSHEQKCVVAISVFLSAAANNQKEARA